MDEGEENYDEEDEEDNTISLVLTPSTNGPCSPSDDEGEMLKIIQYKTDEDTTLASPTPTTETCFLVDGGTTIEEKQCLVQHTDV